MNQRLVLLNTLILFLIYFTACNRQQNNTHSDAEKHSIQNNNTPSLPQNSNAHTTPSDSTSEINLNKPKPIESNPKTTVEKLSPTSTEQIEKPVLQNTNWLAQLKKISKNVDYRLRQEALWKKAQVGHSFERFDALQTQEQSMALVSYKSGSRLDLEENTLIIFDKDPGQSNKNKADRVIVKAGELIGSTTTELWVFTEAGLVQIKPTATSKNAKTQLSLKTDNKLKLKVTSGTADYIFASNSNKIEKINVSVNNDIEINLPKSNSIKTNVDEKETEKLISKFTNSQTLIKKPIQAELVIDYPQNDISVNTNEIELTGNLSSIGAKLLINGSFTIIDDDLKFNKKIQLAEGTNIIVFQLLRSDASTQFYRRTIVYKKEK